MTSTAYGIDTDKNAAISGKQKLECHENVEISMGTPQRRWWGARNIQQLARIKTHTYSCLVLNLSTRIVIKGALT